MFVTAGPALLVATSCVASLQIGYLRTFEELIAKADLVVTAGDSVYPLRSVLEPGE